jgi:TPR repeat protein
VFTALAQCYAKGYGTEVDMKKALEAVDKAAESNLSAFDMVSLAELLNQIEKSNIEKTKSELAYEVLGDTIELSAGQKALVEKLYKEARAGIEKLAEAGNVKAIKLLGDYYMKGIGGVEQDYAKAMELYEQAADEDYADAQAQIAYMYQEGLGVEVSYERAMEWNNRASQQNNAQAQAQIGYMYHMGMGVTQNLDEAGRWYSRAVDQGDPWATVKLAQTELTNSQAYFEAHA